MEYKNIGVLDTFDVNNIPDLDVAVLGALELFQYKKISEVESIQYKRPLVVGSGNAEATGRIIFRKSDAIFASESSYEEKLKNIKDIDSVILISASGEKHAPSIAKTSMQYGKSVTLITNTSNSSAEKELEHEDVNKIYIFPKNREPYTYNTSTYMGMILAYTKENPSEIYDFIQNKLSAMDFSNLSQYDKFYLIVPAQFSEIIRMLKVKFIELFGRNIACDIETVEYVPHGTTIAKSDELFISFGYENTLWGDTKDRLSIPLPDSASYGAMMAVGYFVIGQIQKRHKPYFKDNIVEYTKHASKVFGHEIKPIVD